MPSGLFSVGLCRKEGEGGELGVLLMTLGELHKRREATAHFPCTINPLRQFPLLCAEDETPCPAKVELPMWMISLLLRESFAHCHSLLGQAEGLDS